MQSCSRTIQIKYQDEVINLVVEDDVINKVTLLDNFPEEGKLVYKKNNSEFILCTNQDLIFLNPDISEYSYISHKNLNTDCESNELPILNKARLSRFKEMLDKATNIKKANNDTQDQLRGRKVANKKQEEKQIQRCNPNTAVLPKKLPYVRRVVHVGWLHKKSMHHDFEHMGPAIGRKKIVYLNGNQDYDYAKLKSILKEHYIDDDNRYYFERSAVTLGTAHGDLIEGFTNKLGQKCDFWEYSKILRNQGHKLNIVLLTIIINPDKLSNPNVDNALDSVMKQLETYSNKNLALDTSSATDSKSFKNSNDDSFLERCTISKRRKPMELQSLGSVNSVADLYDPHFSIPSPKYSMLTIKGSEHKNKALPAQTITSRSVKEPNECSTDNVFGSNRLNGNEDIFKKSMTVSQSKEHKSSNVHESRKADTIANYPLCSILKNKTNKNFSQSSPVYSNDKENCDNQNHRLGHFAKPYVVNSKFKSMNLSIPIVEEKDIKFSNVELGRGGQGVVMKGKFLYSDVAIKSMQVTSNDKYILREVKLLDKIRHPNIISIMAVCQTITQVHIVMEFFYSHSLYDVLHTPDIKDKYWLNINNKNKIAQQVCSAVAFLHMQDPSVIHRDIKPSNILVDLTFRTKVCDLGLGQCKSINESLQSTRQGIRGTYIFMAPELIMQQKSASTSSDIWSVACTFIELYKEKKVWNIDPYKNTLLQLINIFQNLEIPSLEGIPTHLQSVFQKCLNYEELKRPGITDLLELYTDKIESLV